MVVGYWRCAIGITCDGEVGEVTGTEHGESSRWDGGSCLIDDFDFGDDDDDNTYHDDFEDYTLSTARLYSFSVRSSRSITVALNYVTEHTTALAITSTSNEERHAWGGYVLRIRESILRWNDGGNQE